jgi:hypothetical protein
MHDFGRENLCETYQTMDQSYVGKSTLNSNNEGNCTDIYFPAAVGTLPKRASTGTSVNYTYEIPSQSVI